MLMTTMVSHRRHADTRYGLQTVCEGDGLANATIVELI
jgi:acetyl-CoA acyltransferase